MNRPAPVEPPPSRFAMPDPAETDTGNDVIAVGADLAPGTLLAAYRAGMFPMPQIIETDVEQCGDQFQRGE